MQPYPSFVATFVDFASFPPVVSTIPNFQITGAAFARGRLVVRAATDSTVRPYRFSLFELEPTCRRLAVEAPWPVVALRGVAGEILVFPEAHARAGRDSPRPAVLRGDALELLDVAPDPASSKSDSTEPHPDAVDLDDGRAVVMWGGALYAFEGSRLTPFSPGAILRSEPGAPMIAFDDAAAICVDNRRVVLIRSNGVRRRILPALHNVMSVHRGPGGALVLVEGDNLERTAFKIYWTKTREITCVAPREVGLEKAGDVGFVVVPTRLTRVVVYGSAQFITIPWSALEALPRQSEQTFLDSHAKLDKKRAMKRKR
ncbi:MAG: hypothetical protein U0271_19865 [Polyangiaceae bacterium]